MSTDKENEFSIYIYITFKWGDIQRRLSLQENGPNSALNILFTSKAVPVLFLILRSLRLVLLPPKWHRLCSLTHSR